MSGGHFAYKEAYLLYIADQIEEDIENNDIPFNPAESDSIYGHQHPPEVIKYLKLLVSDLRKLREVLREYDYAVEGDSSIKDFLEAVKKVYPE
jgi:hypothetical protein